MARADRVMVSVMPPPVMCAPPDADTGAAATAKRLRTTPRLSTPSSATRCLHLNAPATPMAFSPLQSRQQTHRSRRERPAALAASPTSDGLRPADLGRCAEGEQRGAHPCLFESLAVDGEDEALLSARELAWSRQVAIDCQAGRNPHVIHRNEVDVHDCDAGRTQSKRGAHRGEAVQPLRLPDPGGHENRDTCTDGEVDERAAPCRL